MYISMEDTEIMLSSPEILLRLVASLLLGTAIGTEREARAHSAGMRTMALVSLGSCLFQVIAIVGFGDFTHFPHIQLDPSRMASYIIAGIGFLGAGTIMRSQEQTRMKGLTTAATIWVVAGIGLACGCGLLGDAVFVTLLTLVVLIGLRFVEVLFSPRKPSQTCTLVIESRATAGQLISNIYALCARLQVHVEFIRIEHKRESGDTVNVTCQSQDQQVWSRVADAMRELPDIERVTLDLRHIPLAHVREEVAE
jgi:putative Mg2+ transporter-C (MgtC) family protein